MASNNAIGFKGLPTLSELV